MANGSDFVLFVSITVFIATSGLCSTRRAAAREREWAGGNAAVLPGPARSQLTWRDGGSEFVPGQLDFLLFSDSRLDLADGMVIDPAAILPRGAEVDGPSDHLPIVTDLRWKAMAEGRR